MARAKPHGQVIAALDRARARELRARIVELRDAVKRARLERRSKVQTIRTQCRTARVKLRENCHRRADDAKTRGAALIEARRAERDTAASQRKSITRSLPRRKGRTIAERMAESDDAVRRDIPEELIPVFDRVRRAIKHAPKRSRAEAFVEWVEANPEAVVRIQMEQADRDVARLVAEHEAAEREAYELAQRRRAPAKAKARARPGARRARAAREEPPIVVVVDEVPF